MSSTADAAAPLVELAASGRWPTSSDTEAWQRLANVALQVETLRTDLDEARAWEQAARELLTRRLDYAAFIAERQRLLDARLRRRKLDQASLRYRYGFRGQSSPRRPALIRRDIRRLARELARGAARRG